MKTWFFGALVSVLVFAPGWALAQATRPAGGETRPLSAKIVELDGSVKVFTKVAPDGIDAKRDMLMEGGDRIFTGLKSEAKLSVSDGGRDASVFVVAQLSDMTIHALYASGGIVTTHLKLENGKVRGVNVVPPEGAQVRSDFRITTPILTASVTGTEISEISTSPDLGDVVRMGERGKLNVNLPGTPLIRRLSPNQGTTDKMINTIQFTREIVRVGITPNGMLFEERMSAFSGSIVLNQPGANLAMPGLGGPLSLIRNDFSLFNNIGLGKPGSLAGQLGYTRDFTKPPNDGGGETIPSLAAPSKGR